MNDSEEWALIIVRTVIAFLLLSYLPYLFAKMAKNARLRTSAAPVAEVLETELEAEATSSTPTSRLEDPSWRTVVAIVVVSMVIFIGIALFAGLKLFAMLGP